MHAFDYDEGRRCFEFYLNIYQFKTKEECDSWILEKFLLTCYGTDEGNKIIPTISNNRMDWYNF